MTSLAARRATNAAVTLLASGGAVVAWLAGRAALRPVDHVTGWTLFGLVLGLLLFNLRKKLPFLPLASASTWLQLHLWAGVFSCVVFVLHVGARVPRGWLEGTVAVLFLLVAVSGFGGIALSRALPRRMQGERVLHDRIGLHREGLRREAEAVALESIQATGASVIADFHAEALSAFFARPRNVFRHLLLVPRPAAPLLERIHSLRSYQEPAGQAALDRLDELVQLKDHLDHQWVLQGALRYWLFVHVPASYVLLIAVLVHAAVVHAFHVG